MAIEKKASNERRTGMTDIAMEGTTSDRWAIVLAGGDGTRLRSLTRLISGDERPKQFCSILGDESLLDRTIKRVKTGGINKDRLLISLTSKHEKFYRYLHGEFKTGQLAVQPANLGTAPAILYGLMKIHVKDPGASVAFFPSDHFLSDDRSFMKQVDTAFEAADEDPGKIILLGILPSYPETEYGWIETKEEPNAAGGNAILPVKRFWEKPDKGAAAGLMRSGCLWNSFIMAGRVSAFLDMIRRSLPGLFYDFQAIANLIGTPFERGAVNSIYSKLTPVNFSQRVLEVSTDNLTALTVRGVEWSDLGEPGRVLTALESIGVDTEWTAKAGSLAMQAG